MTKITVFFKNGDRITTDIDPKIELDAYIALEQLPSVEKVRIETVTTEWYGK